MDRRPRKLWAVKWRSKNTLDGYRAHLMGRFYADNTKVPEFLAGYTIMVFYTRAKARKWIQKNYGYIKTRPDLLCEPHGWKMPVAVQVTVSIKEVRA